MSWEPISFLSLVDDDVLSTGPQSPGPGFGEWARRPESYWFLSLPWGSSHTIGFSGLFPQDALSWTYIFKLNQLSQKPKPHGWRQVPASQGPSGLTDTITSVPSLKSLLFCAFPPDFQSIFSSWFGSVHTLIFGLVFYRLWPSTN